MTWNLLTEDQRTELTDACYSAMLELAPAIVEYELEQDFGPYPALIRGVKGCYFLDALEREPLGPFPNIVLAKQGFEFEYGEVKSRRHK